MASEVLTGTVNITGYTPYQDDVIADDVLFNIYADARLALFGNDLFSKDTITGAGELRNRGTLAIDDGLTLRNAPLFVNAGTITQSGGYLNVYRSDDEPVTVRNIVGATWTLADTAINDAEYNPYAYEGPYSQPQFVNLGLLEETGSQSGISAQFIDRGGTIQVNGALVFSANVAGDYAGRFVNDTIEGPGTVTFRGNEVFDGSADRFFAPIDYDVLVGTNVSTSTSDLLFVRIVDSVTVSSATTVIRLLNLGAGSTLSLTNPSARVTIQQVGMNQGKIYGAGRFDIKGDDHFLQTTTSLMGEVTIANYGNTTFSNVQLLTYPWTDDQITIENEVGATWTDTNELNISVFAQRGGMGTSVFINNGTFVEDTTNGVNFGMAVVNDDVIEAGANLTSRSSIFSFDDQVTGVGTIEIGVNAVTFRSSVGSGQTLNFTAVPAGANAPTLTLDEPQSFAGLITGFDQNGATDDQIAVNAAGWQFQDFAPNLGGSGGSLIFSNGSAQTSLGLVGDYDPGKFHAAVSGSETIITYG